MNTTTHNTIEQFQARKSELLSQLRTGNHDEVMNLLRQNEAEIKELQKIELLRKVNNKYNLLRSLAKQAYDCEQPTEDITISDGSFHKTKVKKYPKLAEIKYCYGEWKDGLLLTLRINGERFYMYKSTYEYGKDTTYTRPGTFEEFLSLNSIPQCEITLDEYNEMSVKLAALNDQLKESIQAYEDGLKSLKISSYNYWGLIGQHNKNLYEYLPK